MKLEALRLGSRWLTSEPALQRFADALGGSPGAPGVPPAAPPSRTPSARQKASERADAELRAMGA